MKQGYLPCFGRCVPAFGRSVHLWQVPLVLFWINFCETDGSESLKSKEVDETGVTRQVRACLWQACACFGRCLLPCFGRSVRVLAGTCHVLAGLCLPLAGLCIFGRSVQ